MKRTYHKYEIKYHCVKNKKKRTLNHVKVGVFVYG